MCGVFGETGFVAKATNHLGLRGYVLDTKFGPKYDVTKPLVLTGIGQDVSAGKQKWFHLCVTTVRGLPKLFPPILPLQTCFIMLACRGFCNTRVIRGCGTCRNSRHLRHSLARRGPWLIVVFLVHNTESEHCFWLETWTAEICTVLFANVLAQKVVAVSGPKYVHPKNSPSRLEGYFSRDHTCPARLAFALATVLTMKARRLQRTHPLSGIFTSRVKGLRLLSIRASICWRSIHCSGWLSWLLRT